jgi:DNA-nicking Smr family endonuclease
MRKKREPNTEDLHLWWLNTQDVKPLNKPAQKPSEAKAPVKKGNISASKCSLRETAKPLQSSFEVKSRQALRKQNIEAQIDLHGHNHDDAWNELLSFICKAQEKGKRTVLVITGKGSLGSDQTLRVQVPRWLEGPLFSKYVRGYQQSLQKDGGAGAYYVHLKRIR